MDYEMKRFVVSMHAIAYMYIPVQHSKKVFRDIQVVRVHSMYMYILRMIVNPMRDLRLRCLCTIRAATRLCFHYTCIYMQL